MSKPATLAGRLYRLATRIRRSHKLARLRRALTSAGDHIAEHHIRPLILRTRVRHVHGPRSIEYSLTDLVVLCVVRNGASYVSTFMEHHLRLGVAHIVLLDNDSSDDTVAIARRYERVTILRSTCPYRSYETVMKRYLVHRFSRGRWSLFVDIDELFDYPYREELDLRGLLTYLNERAYTAVVAQMLDLFPERSLRELKSVATQPLKVLCTHYDTSNVHQSPYPFGISSNPDIKMHTGGIRKTIFGTDNGLTKAALILACGDLVPFVEWHHAEHARVADFSCVLLHYPFVSTFYDKVEEAVRSDRYKSSAAHEYRAYWARLQAEPDLCLRRSTARAFEGVNALLATGFLVVSPEYVHWVEAHASAPGHERGSISLTGRR